MLTNILPVEATHSSLNLFEKHTLLTSIDGGFKERVGPASNVNAQALEFVGDRENFIDLQNIQLELTCQVLNRDGTALRYPTTDAPDQTNSDRPSFVNNGLHSLFSECDIYVNSTRVSSTNGLYAHKAYLETEVSHTSGAKTTWLKCQGYNYETTPGPLTHTCCGCS